MKVLIVLIIFSMALALIFLGAFIWAVKRGQYDDSHSPAVRILFDDEVKQTKEEKDK